MLYDLEEQTLSPVRPREASFTQSELTNDTRVPLSSSFAAPPSASDGAFAARSLWNAHPVRHAVAAILRLRSRGPPAAGTGSRRSVDGVERARVAKAGAAGLARPPGCVAGVCPPPLRGRRARQSPLRASVGRSRSELGLQAAGGRLLCRRGLCRPWRGRLSRGRSSSGRIGPGAAPSQAEMRPSGRRGRPTTEDTDGGGAGCSRLTTTAAWPDPQPAE